MSKRKTIDDKLDELDCQDWEGQSREVIDLIRQRLGDRSHRVIARAARYCREHAIYEAIPEMAEICKSLMEGGAKDDQNCLAKKALCKSLYELEFDEENFYLRGINFHQLEPGWGGATDSAADIRITCAQGLAFYGGHRSVMELIPLLYDEIASVRIGAVNAIACLDPEKAEIVLRQKVVQGDEEAAVTGACFSSLLEIEPDYSVEFVAVYLQCQDDALVHEAAMALGICSSDEALAMLISHWNEQIVATVKTRHLIKGLALCRLSGAEDLLFEIASQDRLRQASYAIEAIYQYRNQQSVRGKLLSLLQETGDSELLEKFRHFWPEPHPDNDGKSEYTDG